MTMAIRERQENHRLAFRLLIQELGDRAIDTTLFDSIAEPFASQIIRTTWEEIVRAEYVEAVGVRHYRLTAKGWVAGLEITELAQSPGSDRGNSSPAATLRQYPIRSANRKKLRMAARVRPCEIGASPESASISAKRSRSSGSVSPRVLSDHAAKRATSR